MSKAMLRTAVALALICAAAGLPVPAMAQAPKASPPPAAVTPDELAKRLDAAAKLVEVMQLDKQSEAILPQLLELLMPAISRGNTGHEAQIQQIMSEELLTAFQNQRPALLAIYKEAYAKNFTVEELQAMTAFYATPIGQSVLAKMPKLTQDSMTAGAQLGQKAAQDALPRIFSRMQAAQLAVPKGT